MRKPLQRLWTPLAIAAPIASGIAWLCFGVSVPGVIGVLIGLCNAALLIRRRRPLRIPVFVPIDRRKAVVVPTVRYPGNG